MLPRTHLAAWLVFVALTGSRHIWYLYHLFRHRTKKASSSPSHDVYRTCLLYVIYLAIWLGAVFALFVHQFSMVSYLLGMVLLVSGVALRWRALRELKTQFAAHIVIQENHALITQGVYSYVRHPVHLGMIMELLGMAILAQEVWIWGAWVLLLAVTYQRQVREDQMLLETFGEEAREYQAKVPGVNLLASIWKKLRR